MVRMARGTTIVLATVFAAACSSKEANQDSILRAAIDSMPLVTQDSLPRVPWNDGNIVAMLDLVNAGDSAGGALAVSRAANADVKDYGRLMMSDHHRMRQQGRQLAERLNITPGMPPNDTTAEAHDSAMAQLRALPRDRFDAAYIQHEVLMHQHALAVANTAKSAATNAELRQAVTDAIPVIEGHLTRARGLASKYGGISAGASDSAASAKASSGRTP